MLTYQVNPKIWKTKISKIQKNQKKKKVSKKMRLTTLYVWFDVPQVVVLNITM